MRAVLKVSEVHKQHDGTVVEKKRQKNCFFLPQESPLLLPLSQDGVLMASDKSKEATLLKICGNKITSV